MDRISTKQLATLPIEFKLNGRTVIGRPDETLIETAKKNGVEIPHLCYKPGLRPDGNCRAGVVEIKGERVLAPSCCRYPKEGMEVTTDNPRALSLVTSMPATGLRQQEGASTRSPLISTMHERQLPSGRMPGL